MIELKINNKLNGLEDSTIKARYSTLYTLSDDSFYKHIDRIKLDDDTIIIATPSPIDLKIKPLDGVTVSIIKDNRIDIAATQHYGKAAMWRAIAYMNLMSDPLKVPDNTIAIIPNESGLRQFPNPLS